MKEFKKVHTDYAPAGVDLSKLTTPYLAAKDLFSAEALSINFLEDPIVKDFLDYKDLEINPAAFTKNNNQYAFEKLEKKK